MEELADTTLVTLASEHVPDYWMDYHYPRRTPSGRPISQGPANRCWAEVLVHVGMGVGVSPVALRAKDFYSHPGMMFVPLHDAPPIDYGFLWPLTGLTPGASAYLDIVPELDTPSTGSSATSTSDGSRAAPMPANSTAK
ncbi:hypothetical protein [Embleya hyalina]|uniref:LysR family transcriptional regulator n=1 Tax=Embleya hyalina TaxID=516124 RepID=A0A401Z2K5_9ACTN|nr:hypothetical protein [Embleya hyalina]GCE01041.1 LysR family transcriptional regulator [Embleya hyalina]